MGGSPRLDPMVKTSAGLLLYRSGDDGSVELLLVHPGGPYWEGKDLHSWSLPKGEYEPSEDAEHAAVREFTEELGQPPPDGPRIDLGELRQSSGKRVRAWAILAQDFSPAGLSSNEFEMEWPPHSGMTKQFPEVDRAEWMGVDPARERIVRGQTEFIDRLLEKLSPNFEEAPPTLS
jgi:predicted NUDIX family NTP pyrophosphohydrolase